VERAYIIRVASGPEDLEVIFDLILETELSNDRSLITATYETSSYWLAQAPDGEILGCVGLEHGEGASLLRSAAVRLSHQGRGVGGVLSDVAIEACELRKDRAVYLFSSHAGAYWQRRGFEPIDVMTLAKVLPQCPQVLSGLERGWIFDDVGWVRHLSDE
jgi:N-acetylglutamate synthase-like GNAT family acetyltransferase